MAIQRSLNYRHKTLLGLLNAFGGRLPAIDFQKYLFLYAQEFEQEPSFEFIPYKYGCFSYQSYADKRKLVDAGMLQLTDDWRLQKDKSGFDLSLDKSKYIEFHKKYSNIKGEALIKHVYKNYPYYAIHSEIAERLLLPVDLKRIQAERPKLEEQCFFTIGYEGSTFEGYLNRLIKNNIKALIDVRRNPLSRKYGFSKGTLSESVKKLGIEYIHMPKLGISSEERQELNSLADYKKLFDSYEKQQLSKNQQSILDLHAIFIKHGRVAITCFEADVCMCHRSRVATAISKHPEWKYKIQHI